MQDSQKGKGPWAYSIFHCNLAFSSIEVEDRQKVIRSCYWPLLELVEGIDVFPGIELTGYTLETIQEIDPKWVEKFRSFLEQGKCELIGSGESQVIGPVVPGQVNIWNQRLGLETYERILGFRPRVAYVNEQALSSGLIDIYLDEGYEALVVEWDNLASHNSEWEEENLYQPQALIALSGRSMPVLWNWSIAFQKLQRACHGQLLHSDYVAFVNRTLKKGMRAFPLYGNDVEVFNFRPGRFREETQMDHPDEWGVLTSLLEQLDGKLEWQKPSDILARFSAKKELQGFTAQHPITVKKQQKYNLTRWCLSGRNDLLLNSYCHRVFDEIKSGSPRDDDAKKGLCRLWASDFRTHITTSRYRELIRECNLDEENDSQILPALGDPVDLIGNMAEARLDEFQTRLSLSFGGLDLSLNLKRGGAIHHLGPTGQEPVIGTVEHGQRKHVALAADFYSNHVVMELVADRRRVTDLHPCSFRLYQTHNQRSVLLRVPFGDTWLTKIYCLQADGTLKAGIYFERGERPFGTLRLGYLTFLSPEIETFRYACHNGGEFLEKYDLKGALNHGNAVSSLVSASGCLGATEGLIKVSALDQVFCLSWEKQRCAAVPLVHRELYPGEQLNRLFFSLSELDDTFVEGGRILPFEWELSFE